APTAQRTVTGSGAAVISAIGSGPYIDKVMIGRIEDLGIKDINNMGAAMAPAAARTVIDFLRDSNTTPADYDMILTGDLGSVGSELLLELLQTRENTDISQVHKDCGVIIFDAESQQVNAGGSGCACSAAVFCSLIMRLLKENVINKVLLVGTGALMSSTSAQQGRTIPSIAHAVSICN
ncbi:MAG: stage V sporulation protein AD, partial [Oscillospiraceae bacterium]|nr:stage V sporulation protein AD [Oscillospiraceae bacterium]